MSSAVPAGDAVPWPAPGPAATPQALLDAIDAYLEALPPVQRVETAAVLADTRTAGRWATARRRTLYQATEPRGQTYAVVADEYGISVSAVNKAVSEYRKTLEAEAARE